MARRARPASVNMEADRISSAPFGPQGWTAESCRIKILAPPSRVPSSDEAVLSLPSKTPRGRHRGDRHWPHRHQGHPGRRHAWRRQVTAARSGRHAPDRGRQGRAHLLGCSPRQSVLASGGGLRRPELARDARPQPLRPRRPQHTRSVARPRWLHHHLPGRRGRARPAPQGVSAAPDAAGHRRDAPSPGAGRNGSHCRRTGRSGRRGRGQRLVARHPAAPRMRDGPSAALGHAGAGGREGHPVAALPQGAKGSHPRGRVRRPGLGCDTKSG